LLPERVIQPVGRLIVRQVCAHRQGTAMAE
jgi:hypothetical protein